MPVKEPQTRLDGGARDTVLVDLALQGGGSHGAFTWGVLDRLMDEPWLRIDAISGTSAGAMNAVVLAGGFAADGPAGAKFALSAFWRRVADSARFSPIRRSPFDVVLGRWTLDTSPFYLAFDLASRVFSPYDLKFAGANPLQRVLADSVDFAQVARSPIRLFVTATNVHTGRGRVFRNAELTPDIVLASACLPTLFRAIEIDGQSYWDGGYAGNPTITPLVRESDSHDTLLVAVNPIERPETPRSAREILDRVNEVSFNATLLKELRMIALLRQVVDAGTSEGRKWAEMRMHLVTSKVLADLGASSKFNAEWDFLCMLRDEGRRAAEAFLAANSQNIGKRSSMDLDVLLQQV
jgi:NTE family protein